MTIVAGGRRKNVAQRPPNRRLVLMSRKALSHARANVGNTQAPGHPGQVYCFWERGLELCEILCSSLGLSSGYELTMITTGGLVPALTFVLILILLLLFKEAV